MKEKHFAILRRHMVDVIGITAELACDELGKDVLDERVMAAMGRVPRHRFAPPELALHAYDNSPLPIGFNKTISQPFIVAAMIDLLDPQPDSVVLEVGTGVGYQTSIVAELAREVWSVEIVEELATIAEANLKNLGYDNVSIRVGDGSKGWYEHAPFDRILVSAASKIVPPALIEELKPGGKLVIPLGSPESQKLTVVEKGTDGGTRSYGTMAVRFTQLETF